ncbi:uncharacterized protein LOC128627560 [Artibeus jamaicensis]|uniref:uncharacterized protein LOC128627560 n=1 Tax=Artibeus jamaicensis TaxID=9417 RepID=UPI00235A8E99|nr:uncharacterized protein LOC128627560 [Artibeus jamaicensis]XP_053522150.1 uncharacterized protein LOC128627560 [Artibeus jamaicensis]XP_053522151.1 uncharacterized protein LOC128627560 [Artibeus jamaicensis]XP_053522152.1 uncharacterized protein LOC128627560 [Artibeus jamaicensis]XP_053522153.1 uncharacterized protein LOC128627560 [Artibeus jamaicensis]XP_053522154.1 uncharacterized protein LOC128627560 [Artibeus jamaicensis]XP_053522155.1 uncharacterized protein LOC128627560 [Artibeus jam
MYHEVHIPHSHPLKVQLDSAQQVHRQTPPSPAHAGPCRPLEKSPPHPGPPRPVPSPAPRPLRPHGPAPTGLPRPLQFERLQPPVCGGHMTLLAWALGQLCSPAQGHAMDAQRCDRDSCVVARACVCMCTGYVYTCVCLPPGDPRWGHCGVGLLRLLLWGRAPCRAPRGQAHGGSQPRATSGATCSPSVPLCSRLGSRHGPLKWIEKALSLMRYRNVIVFLLLITFRVNYIATRLALHRISAESGAASGAVTSDPGSGSARSSVWNTRSGPQGVLVSSGRVPHLGGGRAVPGAPPAVSFQKLLPALPLPRLPCQALTWGLSLMGPPGPTRPGDRASWAQLHYLRENRWGRQWGGVQAAAGTRPRAPC